MGKHTITIDDSLYNDISEYCKINGLKINAYCNSLLKREHNMSKFGDIPFGVFGDVNDKKETNSVVITENNPVLVEETKQIEKETTEVNIASESDVLIQDKKDIKPKKRRL